MRRTGEAVGAVALLILAFVCWHLGVTEDVYSAVPDGQPQFDSTRYSGSWIAVALVCVVAAGLLVVDAVRLTVRNDPYTG